MGLQFALERALDPPTGISPLPSGGTRAAPLTLQIRSDNRTVCAYVNHQGGRFSELDDIAQRCWDVALQRGYRLQCRHIAGADNVEADELSRPILGAWSWSLNSSVFKDLETSHGPFSVDAFATRLTAKLPRYWTLLPDSQAEATDAFAQTWAGEQIYAFPPPLQIAATARKAREERACVTLLTPDWPTQPWYPLLVRMCKRPQVLTTPHQLLTPSPLTSSPNFSHLLVWNL